MTPTNLLLGHGVFNYFGWSRDDLKWTIGIVAAVILALSALGDSVLQGYGIPAGWLPYIRLAAFVVGVVSASAKGSGVQSAAQADGTAVSAGTTKSLPVVLLAVALAGGMLTLAACAESLQQAITTGYATAQTTLETADDTLHLTCYGTKDLSQIPVAQVGHCNTPMAQLLHLTDDLNGKISAEFVSAYAAQIRLGPAILNLQNVQAVPMPADVAADLTYATNVNSLVQAIDPKAPSAQSLIDAIGKWVAAVKSLAGKFTTPAPTPTAPAAGAAS